MTCRFVRGPSGIRRPRLWYHLAEEICLVSRVSNFISETSLASFPYTWELVLWLNTYIHFTINMEAHRFPDNHISGFRCPSAIECATPTCEIFVCEFLGVEFVVDVAVGADEGCGVSRMG